MTFDKKILLLKLERQNGKGGFAEKARRYIRANVKDVGVTTQYAAAAANREASLQVICFRKEFKSDNFTHVEYDGHRYRIESTGPADTILHIKLILAKGG